MPTGILDTHHTNGQAILSTEQTEFIQRILGRFQNVEGPTRKGRYMATCPAHADSSPSLEIRPGADNNSVWLKCYAGCDKDRILERASLTMSDLFLYGGGYAAESDIPAVVRQAIRERRTFLRHLDKDATPARVAALAANLGVTQAALRAFGIGWYNPWHCYTFPMRNCNCKVVGHATRSMDGTKRVLLDSDMGLYIPRDFKLGDKLVVCEGLTDAMAGWDMGLPVIGRRNCNEGLEDIRDLIGNRDVAVTVVADNDPPNDEGRSPGLEGAKALAHRLHGKVARIPQPDLYKDLRQYHDAGQTDLSWLGVDVTPRTEPVRGYGIAAGAVAYSDLMQMQFPVNWIVEGVMTEGEPMLIIGPDKSFKTHVGFDLAFSIAAGTPWLGKFEVPHAMPVVMIASESPLRRHKEVLRRIACERACSGMAVPLYTFDRVPDLASNACLDEIAAFVREKQAKIVLIDPAYNGMNGDRAENQFLMGAQLFNIRDVFREAGATMGLSCHSRKGAGSNYDPIELRDVAWAGFSSFAGQWLLLNSRKRHSDEDGHTYQQWLGIGGRDGQSGTWGLDINEGPPERRQWDVEVISCSASRREDRVQRAHRRRQEDEAAFLAAVTRYPSLGSCQC